MGGVLVTFFCLLFYRSTATSMLATFPCYPTARCPRQLYTNKYEANGRDQDCAVTASSRRSRRCECCHKALLCFFSDVPTKQRALTKISDYASL